jgi:hypothetical protein
VSANWLATRIYSYMSSSVVQLSPPIAPNQTECLLSLTRRWLCCCSIGGAPSIDNPQFVPSFPLQLAWLNITANLRKFDRRTVSNFIHIESPPGSWHEYHEVQNVTKSISEVYLYVAEVLDELCLEYGEKQVFIGDPARQVLATTAEGETVQQVTNMSGAKAALITIADQGSGCPVAGDTKGWPEVTSIFETPQEGGLAHFARFNEIRDGRMYARNDTWKTGPRGAFITPPIQWADVFHFRPNPKISNFPVGSPAHTASFYFARNYTQLLRKLHVVFNGQPNTLMSTLGAMYRCASTTSLVALCCLSCAQYRACLRRLRTLAVDLMRTPDPRTPPHSNPPTGIGPPWEYVPLDRSPADYTAL